MMDLENKTDSPLSLSGDSENFVDENNYYIFGIFDETIGKHIMPNLVKEIDRQANLKNGVIRFFIDSNGGYTRYLWNLISLIEKAKKAGVKVETHVYGVAYSCGSMLACAGSPGSRFIGENAEHLCHLGGGSVYATNDTELERGEEHLKAHFNKVRKMYKKYAKIKNLDKVIANDMLFIRGEDIIKNGLADKFIEKG